MALDIFVLHNDPKILNGYSNRKAIVPHLAYNYASVTRRRFPNGEPAIMRSSHLASMYAHYVLTTRWEEAEPIIFTDPNNTYEYIRDVIGRRFEPAEPYIKEGAWASLHYALKILHDRFIEGEDIISTNGVVSFYYAEQVIKGRWIKGEESIIQNDPAFDAYVNKFIVPIGRCPDFEKLILQHPQSILTYIKLVVKGHWEEGAEVLRQSNYASLYDEYNTYLWQLETQ